MSKSLVFFFLACSLTLSACSLFYPSCKNNVSDKYVMRASVEVQASDLKLAEEKALSHAQRHILEQIDSKIEESISYKKFLADSEYEKKLSDLRQQILNECEVSCSRSITKAGKIVYSTTLQINVSVVEKHINTIK